MYNYNRVCGRNCGCTNMETEPQYTECNCGCSYAESNSCNCGCNYVTTNNNDCDCGYDYVESPFPANPMLAQSYVPVQKMGRTFTPHCALKMGTIFPELVSPYMPCQSVEEINYLKGANEIGEGCNKCC